MYEIGDWLKKNKKVCMVTDIQTIIDRKGNEKKIWKLSDGNFYDYDSLSRWEKLADGETGFV